MTIKVFGLWRIKPETNYFIYILFNATTLNYIKVT